MRSLSFQLTFGWEGRTDVSSNPIVIRVNYGVITHSVGAAVPMHTLPRTHVVNKGHPLSNRT